MNVLSLFDGKSSGYTALELAGIPVTNYYSAEIDKYAIQVSQVIHPYQYRLGDVTKWREWDLDFSKIDLLLGGFPCQAWSMAGKQLGDKDERGMLFWVMLDIFKYVKSLNPNVKFLIENVKMKREFEQYITHHTEEALGHVEKHLINSALVSAQNRQRYYWTNIDGIEQPEDRHVYLWDILSDGFTDAKKSFCIDANYHKGGNLNQYFNKHRRQLVFCGAMRGRYIVDGKRQDSKIMTAGLTKQRIEVRYDGETNSLTTVQKDNNVVYDSDGRPYYSLDEIKYRKLTPRECFRLQTTPEPYIDKILACGVSNSQLYKIAGNGWTDEVIAHIFRYLRK